jgi:hypothetical protein
MLGVLWMLELGIWNFVLDSTAPNPRGYFSETSPGSEPGEKNMIIPFRNQ